MEEEYSVGSWQKVKVIGRGGSSTVYQCVVKATGNYLAVKEIVTDGMSADQIKGIGGEVDTIKNLSHANIVRCFGSQQVSNKLYIMLEYCGRGSLRKLYQEHGKLSEPQAARCVTQILRGLEYLHANGVAHRDVKGANILLASDGVLKLADFGASKKMETESLVSGLKGTPHWMAPEVIKGTQMSTGWMKADVWSLGCTLVEVLSASLPFSEYDNPMTAMYQIASGKIPPLPPGASAEATSFVRDCCAADPEARPAVSALLQHPFLARCKPPDGSQEFSGESELFDITPGLEPADKMIRAVSEGSTDVETQALVPSVEDGDAVSVEESYVDDDVEAVHSADVSRFVEQRKGAPIAKIGGLSVRTSSFRVSDGDYVPDAPLECEETPVLHKSRKSVHTMSSHNILKMSDSQLTAATPAAGESRRPPLQVSTERMSISGGIAQLNPTLAVPAGSSSRRTNEDPEDIMDTVISPRLTSLKVSSTANTPKAFFGKKRTLSIGSSVDSSDGDLSRATTANVMPLRASEQIHMAGSMAMEPSEPPAPIRPDPPVSQMPTAAASAVSEPPAEMAADPEPAQVVFQMGRSDSGQSSSSKSHVTPIKRKHRGGRKNSANYTGNGNQPADNRQTSIEHVNQTAQKQQLKLGTVNIGGSHDNAILQDSSQTPTTKTINMDESSLLQACESPRISDGVDSSEGSSTEIVITASGGHKRKLKPAPPGSIGGAPHKVSTNGRRNYAGASSNFSKHNGVTISSAAIDLAKSSALPSIGSNQHSSGLTGKKKDKHDQNKGSSQLENVDNLLRPTAPLSSDKLQYSGELHNTYGSALDGGLTHGSSTGSTTISEACAIAAESNYGKFGPSPIVTSNSKDKDEYRSHLKHHSHRHNTHSGAPVGEHRQVRQINMPKGRLTSLKHSSVRSHSAGVVPVDPHPLSNNMSSSASRPQLPVIRHMPGLNSDANEDVLRAIQTAPAPSRLPPIGPPSGGVLGSLTPSNKVLGKARPPQDKHKRHGRGEMEIS